MIQRIQTLYLLLALAIQSSVFFSDLGVFCGPERLLALRFSGLFDITDSTSAILFQALWPLATLAVVMSLLLLVSIFSFRHRPLQMRLCGIAVGLELGLSGLIYYLCSSIAADSQLEWPFGFIGLLPAVSVIPTILAYRAIHRDELIIKSLDRLR